MAMLTISIASAPKIITCLPNTSISSVPSFKGNNLPSAMIANGGLLIECSSRPQKKATKHHMKTRPRKTQPWDIRRKPTVYAPLPRLPPDWTLVSSGGEYEGGAVAEEVGVAAASTLEAPASSG